MNKPTARYIQPATNPAPTPNANPARRKSPAPAKRWVLKGAAFEGSRTVPGYTGAAGGGWQGCWGLNPRAGTKGFREVGRWITARYWQKI